MSALRNPKTLLGLVVSVLGLLVLSLIFVLPGLGTFGWESTSGTIDSYSKRRASSTRRNREPLKVRYSYEVDGRTYSSDRYVIGTALMAPGAQTMRTGTPVTVYYDPDQPSSSVLSRGIGGRTLLFLLPFVILLFVSSMPERAAAVVRAMRRR